MTVSNDPPATSETPTGQPPGTEVLLAGHFDLLEELGQGSSGTVYRARLQRRMADLEVGAEVAVKFLRRDLLFDPEAHARLEAEGRIGHQIRSDQVVRIYAVESLQVLGMTATYLVMELIRGHSLRTVLRDTGSVVEELARRIGMDAARGLRAVHELGLVHRDVKPENLALTDAGTVKLMDLGLVRRVQRQDADPAAGFYGSLSYAAPEVLLGQSAQPASDLYSLGVVLFEMVTGRHPFQPPAPTTAFDADAIIQAHIGDPPPRPSHFKPRISAFLEQLILDLLAKDPQRRPASAAELAGTLERGENSRYWIRFEHRAPLLASRRRLRSMRRTADVAFVGRREELRRLDGLLRRAMDGRGRMVFLSGPGGMGRRRLLDHWLEEWLERRDDIVFLGGEARGGEGLWRAAPFTEMLLDWFLRGDRPDSPNAQSRLLARIAAESDLDPQDAAQLAAIIGEGDLTATPEERADLIARQLFAMRPANHTLVLRIDRAEELSTTAHLIVQRLLDDIGRHPVLVVLVSLDGRRPLPGMEHIALHGLSESEYLTLADRLFADRAVPTELVRAAHNSLAGSPGNLLDALSLLARERRILGPIGQYRLVTPVADLRPARSLLDRLRQRVALLSPEQRFVHLAAAVLGQSFPIAELAALVGQSELAVLEALSVFQSRIIVTHRGTGRFRHRDFRKELLRIAPLHARRRLHRMAAWTLEDRGGPVLDIGLHLSRAGEHAAAIPPLLAGLEQLLATGSRQNSQRVRNRLRIHFDAIAGTAAADRLAAERGRFLLLAGRSAEVNEHLPRARQYYQQALEDAAARRDDPARAAAGVALGQLDLANGRLHDTLATVGAALDAIAGQPDAHQELRARGLGLRARALGYLGQSEAALAELRTAIGMLPRDAGDLRPHLHVDLARLEALRNHFVAALKSLDRAHREFDVNGSRPGLVRVLLHQGHVLAMIGSRRQAIDKLRDACDRARQLANPRAQAKAELFLGELWTWHGEGDRAIPHLAAAVRLATAPGDHLTRLFAGLYLAQLGREPAGLEAEIRELEVPALRIGWLVMAARRDGRPELLEQAVELERDVTIPLHLHRQLLIATGREKAAGYLVREIADRLPAGSMRRRFLAFVR